MDNIQQKISKTSKTISTILNIGRYLAIAAALLVAVVIAMLGFRGNTSSLYEAFTTSALQNGMVTPTVWMPTAKAVG